MNYHLTQNVALKKQLTLTPTMNQSLAILSMSSAEMLSFIEKVLEENPFLSYKNELINRLIKEDKKVIRKFWRNESTDVLSEITSSNGGMEDYLHDQLMFEKECKGKKKQALLYLIQHLTDRGYLKCSLEEIEVRYNLTSEEAHSVLNILQSFEPAGIGARNLAECLSLQLRCYRNTPIYLESIINNHLEAVADKNFEMLAEIYNCSDKEIEEAIDFIKSLNPFPVDGVSNEENHYIVPNLTVRLYNGEMMLTVNDSITSDLIVNDFMDEIDLEDNEEFKAFKNEAFLLKTGIDKRLSTLYKVAYAILQAQTTFLEEGKEQMKPLKLADIAKKIGFHESTIHRTIRGKYIETPYGLYQLKDFFKRGLKKSSGTNQDIDWIKDRIKELINQEDSANPYSDQTLSNLLKKENIEIARRTIAKYRQEMNLKPANGRILNSD